MKYIFISIILCLTFSISSAQNTIEIALQSADNQYVYLLRFKGDLHEKVDSAIVENNIVVFSGNYAPGMYIAKQGKNAFSFLINESKLSFRLEKKSSGFVSHVLQSNENKIWFEFLKQRDQAYAKMDMLKTITLYYDKQSAFYQQAITEYNAVQDKVYAMVETAPKNSLVRAYILANLNPRLAPTIPYDKQIEGLKKVWFKDVDWHNEALIYSDILTNKIRDYLGLFNEKGKSRAILEDNFKIAVSNVLDWSFGNAEVHDFIKQFLVNEFQKYGFETLILHIAQNYNNAEQCEMEASQVELAERLKQYQLMKVGKTAPDFVMKDTQGEEQKLSEMLGEKNLVLFWSSQCTHCVAMLPEVQRWYAKAKAKGWNLITISMDTDKKLLAERIKLSGISFPVLCDFLGWESPIVRSYNIYSSPTMIVLDQERKIIKKPRRVWELK